MRRPSAEPHHDGRPVTNRPSHPRLEPDEKSPHIAPFILQPSTDALYDGGNSANCGRASVMECQGAFDATWM